MTVIILLAFSAIPQGIFGMGDGAAASIAAQNFTATMDLLPAKAKIGETVEVRGTQYPPNADVELVWYTVKGWYNIEQRSEFVGQVYEMIPQVLATARSDAEGNLGATLVVPVGFGGPHDLRGRVNGQEISQAGLLVQPTLTMSPQEGPIGTPIELTIAGVDLRPNINTWHVLYDNHYLGFVSAVTTNGVAVARFRASGPVGNHLVEVWNNSYNSTPYLAWDTGPFRNDFEVGQGFPFRVTNDPGILEPVIDNFRATDNPWPVESPGPGKLTLSVDRGIVGQATTLSGTGLPADTDLKLIYLTMVGNRVSGVGFSEAPRDLGTVRTSADGTFTYDMTLPDDLGGHHRVEAVAGDQILAATGFVVIPSVIAVGPEQVRSGEKVEIHLKGVGWTTYDNTYAVTYDNSYIGYVCGFSTNGDVQFTITAVGTPGTHIIDLYPTIYKGTDPMPRVYSLPQLTYTDDHPQRLTPAIRLSIEIVE